MKPNQQASIKIAVRDFAQPLVKQGDLSWEQNGGMSLDVGQEIHQDIQQRLQLEYQGYQSEYAIQHRFLYDGITIVVSGRCDGKFPAAPEAGLLFAEDEQDVSILEEIKSSFHVSYLKKQLLEQKDHPYWLQLRSYLHLCRQKNTQNLRGRLRLVCSRTRQEEILDLLVDDEDEFRLWCESRCQQIVEEYQHFEKLKQLRQGLHSELQFPFADVRSSQQKLMDFIQSKIKKYRQLMIQAPTGLGKTAGVLYPALRRALKKGAPVFYLTPKNSQFQAALQFAKASHAQGLPLKILILSARSKICLNAELHCHAEHCDFAKSYYDKLTRAGGLDKRDDRQSEWSASYFSDLGRWHQICPYELSMTRLREADLIVCDYNYLVTFRGGLIERYLHPYLNLPKPLLVIDEAHNLYSRAMENFSPALKREFFQDILVREQERIEPRGEILDLVKAGLKLFELRPEYRGEMLNPYEDPMSEVFIDLQQIILEQLAQGENISLEDPLFTLYSQLSDILALSQMADENFRFLEQRDAAGKVESLKLVCLDPGPLLQPLYAAFDRVVLFSATLKPFDFYRNMSGLTEDDCLAAEFHSPFPRQNKKIIMIPQVATSYRERHLHYPRIAEIIRRTIPLGQGHYFAFFPSYRFMAAVADTLEDSLPDYRIYRQEGALTQKEIDAILQMLQPHEEPCLILAVQGGSLAEGMDFKGRGVRGVFVVGPGLPNFSPERKLMEDYYQKRYGKAREYTYTFPAMAKAVQAAGRVVRSHDERGLVIMMDRRFLQKDYAAAMPGDWFQNDPRELVSTSILRDIEDFWSMTPENEASTAE
ncbi:MAG: ATP-dependent DNA helicase [Oligoflexus sp.]